ncbi:glycoside hydrolase family 12 protein [Trichoderma citrinoviride]|uniref:Glycoside hydrolase family 12 protein n=1 Tax=Trichoderma citrinoviride TaxID=58853 RepID=A0A2T4AZV2_9HYPO|nr:glycoside hydrolase family 12 protein [Trichoderma citrinoviride]PTB62604.1 glycoside hydrolase family 12 protein [Trichoderma citrinoviride]
MKLIQVLPALLPAALAQTSCDQWATFSGNGYTVSNNLWGASAGSGFGCVTADSLNGAASWHADWQWSGGQNNVKSYQNVQIDIPQKRTVNSIGSMPTTASWSYSGSDIRANVAYDLFTAANPNHVTYSGDYELMICWTLYYGYNGAMQVYSFVAQTNTTSYSGDVKNFFNYLRDNKGYNAGGQYVLSYQFGTEPFTGSGTLNVASWTASIN